MHYVISYFFLLSWINHNYVSATFDPPPEETKGLALEVSCLIQVIDQQFLQGPPTLVKALKLATHCTSLLLK